jgi:hypothetical protein
VPQDYGTPATAARSWFAAHLPTWWPTHLSAGASLTDLGSHRLHDLWRPVHQLSHPDLSAGFPPLRSLDRHPHNLAVQLTSFVGREAALTEVAGLLASQSPVTVIG